MQTSYWDVSGGYTERNLLDASIDRAAIVSFLKSFCCFKYTKTQVILSVFSLLLSFLTWCFFGGHLQIMICFFQDIFGGVQEWILLDELDITYA